MRSNNIQQSMLSTAGLRKEALILSLPEAARLLSIDLCNHNNIIMLWDLCWNNVDQAVIRQRVWVRTVNRAGQCKSVRLSIESYDQSVFYGLAI